MHYKSAMLLMLVVGTLWLVKGFEICTSFCNGGVLTTAIFLLALCHILLFHQAYFIIKNKANLIVLKTWLDFYAHAQYQRVNILKKKSKTTIIHVYIDCQAYISYLCSGYEFIPNFYINRKNRKKHFFERCNTRSNQ